MSPEPILRDWRQFGKKKAKETGIVRSHEKELKMRIPQLSWGKGVG